MKHNSWINLVDLMTVLMMIFLFISISYLYQVENKSKQLDTEREEINLLKKRIETLSFSRNSINFTINKTLNSSLKKKLNKWGAIITKDNTIVFENTGLLFKSGSSQLNKSFSIFISEFFPILVKKIDEKHLKSIEYIEIDGHSSSEWGSEQDELGKYLYNLNLSQERAYAVLKQCLKSIDIQKYGWVLKKLRSRGASSSRPIYIKRGSENEKLSRRVEFKITLKDKETLQKIFDITK